MAIPYSIDLRERVILKYNEGKSVLEIVNELNVKKSFVYNILRLYKETRSVAPKPANGGRNPEITEEILLQIEALIMETPDITLHEIKNELGLSRSISGICDAINKRLKLRLKKTLFDTGQNDEEVQEAREAWKNDQSEMDSNFLVFIDESSINIGMTRLFGRAFGETRVVDYVPDVRFDRVSVLSSIRLDGTLVPLTFKGTLNGKLFLSYVTECLTPTLKAGDIVIMDNASPHKVKGVTEAIEQRGAFVLYLPTYSPDLNPIELMWSKIKSYLRKVKARTIDSLYDALKDAFNLISTDNIKGWFSGSNYSA